MFFDCSQRPFKSGGRVRRPRGRLPEGVGVRRALQPGRVFGRHPPRRDPGAVGPAAAPRQGGGRLPPHHTDTGLCEFECYASNLPSDRIV